MQKTKGGGGGFRGTNAKRAKKNKTTGVLKRYLSKQGVATSNKTTNNVEQEEKNNNMEQEEQ